MRKKSILEVLYLFYQKIKLDTSDLQMGASNIKPDWQEELPLLILLLRIRNSI